MKSRRKSWARHELELTERRVELTKASQDLEALERLKVKGLDDHNREAARVEQIMPRCRDRRERISIGGEPHDTTARGGSRRPGQCAAKRRTPPGGGSPPSGSPPSGGLFGEILDRPGP